MALVVADRVQETTTTTGTGTYTLAGAKDGFQSFAAVGDGNTTYYACTDGTDYEVGIGTYTLSGTTLARTTIIESSNSDLAVSWGAGSKDIFVTSPADKTLLVGRNLYADNPSSPTAPSATGNNAVAIGGGATSTNNNTTAVGSGADATGNGSGAFGRLAQATGLSSHAFGLQANASGSYATAIGRGGGVTSVSAGSGSTSIGGAYASGTDSLAAAIANNTSSYGATGANSVAIGPQAKATGQRSFAATYGVSNNQYSIAFGPCVADQARTFSSGFDAGAYEEGKFARSSGSFNSSSYGQAQYGLLVLRSDTTNATAEALTSNNSAASTTNQIILQNNSAFAFHGTIVARQKAGDGTASAAWKVEGLIRREGSAGTTVLVNSATTVLDNTPSWGMALSADTTNGGLAITATGAASTNIRWVATIHTSEVTYA